MIVGNPPWSAGQDFANDDNQNEKYPSLDGAIRATYAQRSTATNKNSLYDSYIRAIKWATLRIKERGVVVYVTNGGFLDSNTADGLRMTLADEFSAVYVYTLRGNARTSGEQRKKEGGTVFGAGSRATVAITLLIKDPANTEPATIYYADVGDYLTAEQKLQNVSEATSISGLEPVPIKPNAYGDWLNQRRDDFGMFLPVGDKARGSGAFVSYGDGVKTNRDPWAYSFSRDRVAANMRSMIAVYEGCRAAGAASDDATQISWSRALRNDFARGRSHEFREEAITIAAYRPFVKQRLYFDRTMNDSVSRQPSFFPGGEVENLGIYMIAPGESASFALLATDAVPDLHFLATGQYFPRWFYERTDEPGTLELAVDVDMAVDGHRRVDNVSNEGLERLQSACGTEISGDDVFAYVYGLLHSSEYRTTYAADLKRLLPRIPLVEDPWPFIDGGRELLHLHLDYESADPYPLDGLDVVPTDDPFEFFAVEKMTFAKNRNSETKRLEADRSTVIYNSHITVAGIPEDVYRYMLGSRSAIEWIIDRYQVKTDKASGIVNDPNDWSNEVGDPRYIIDLLARIVTVSLRTMQVVDGLPALAIREDQGVLSPASV